MKTRILSVLLVFAFAVSLLTPIPQTAKADYISTQSEVISEARTKGFAAFYPGAKRSVASFGFATLDGIPFMENEKLYVPIDSLDFIFLSNHINSGDYTYIDGENVTEHTKIKDGIRFISLEAYVDIMDLKVFDDPLSDLYLVGNNEVSYTWHTDRKMLSGIIGQMVFEFPGASKIVADIEKKNGGTKNHPRIMATEETFERIKRETGIIESDDYQPLKEYWLELIIADKEYWTNMPYLEYGPTDHIRMRAHSERFYYKAGYNSFLYKLTGDETYAQTAWNIIELVCSDAFPDWNPRHLLDTGQFMNGMAISYDWLYDWLTEDQKATMRRAMVDKGISVLNDIYDGKPVYSSWSEYGRSYPFFEQSDNWNFVCCGGALMAALAIYDECEGEDRQMCERVLQDSVKVLSYAVTCMSPSGDWYEGPAYARLTNETLTEACASLLTSAGTDYGILLAPGVLESSEAPFALMGEYSFNISNAGEVTAGNLPNTRELFFYADYFNREDFATQQFMLMDKYNVEPDFRDMIYCTKSFDNSPMSLQNDYYLKTSEIVTMRNTDSENGLIFAGLHGGENKSAQGHLDVGQFMIDSFGDRFASDLGVEDYNSPIPYYERYRNRAEGHNTLVINPNGRVYDQTITAVGIMRRYEHNASSSIAVVEMTGAYEGYVSTAHRGMKFINNRTSILLQDEVRGISPKADGENELYWFMHTKASINLLNNNKVAELDINGNKMYATLLTDGEFGFMEPKPLPSSPNGAGQNENKGFQKLYIHLSNITNADIAVCFTPGLYYESTPLPDVVPLAKWTLDNAEIDGVTARLSSILVDGNPLEGFDANVFAYEYKNCKTGKLPEIKAEGNATVSVEYPFELPGDAYITVSDNTSTATYTLHLSEAKDKFENAGFAKQSFSKITSSVADASKTADSNADTSIVLNNDETITYMLNSKTLVNYITLTGDNLDTSVYVSGDGINFEYVADIKTSSDAIFLENNQISHIRLLSNKDSVKVAELGAYAFNEFEYETTMQTGETLDFVTALYEVGELEEKNVLTFDGFEGDEEKNSMPEGLEGLWSYGYTSGSKLKIVSFGDFGKTGDGLRFESHQKHVEDTNGDGKVDGNDEPAKGYENIANNDFQYPRLHFVPNSMGDDFEISFSANFKNSYIFFVYSSLDGSNSLVSYSPYGGVSLMQTPVSVDVKNNLDDWFDFKLNFKSDGTYTATVTNSTNGETETVSGSSEFVKSHFTSSTKCSFRFQQNSYTYKYHDVLLDDIYIGRQTDYNPLTNNAKFLKSVHSQKITLDDNVTLTDKITIPDDGKKYEASVFVWKSGKLLPITQNIVLN